MDKARIGVIGAGWWGTVGHIEPLTREPLAELVAIYSRTEDKVRQRAAKYGVPRYYTDFRRMIDECELDGVVVATTPNAHYEPARYALEHGLHVLVEKPFMLQAKHAEELGRIATERNLLLSVCHPLLYSPLLSQVRHRIREDLGEVLMISAVFAQRVIDLYRGDVQGMFSWRRKDDGYPVPNAASYSDPDIVGGGEGHTQASHVIGAVLWLTGLGPESVWARMNNLNTSVDVVDAITVRFENGALGTISANGMLPHGIYVNHVHVQGERGVVHLDAANNSAYARMEGDRMPWTLDASRQHYERDALTRNFVRTILGHEELLVGMQVAIDEVRILDAAYRSAETGQPVDVASLVQ